jgi:hypothetical protein
MRKTLLVGLVLTLAAVLVVFVSAGLDLELESVALLGVAVGAVVALVPDRTPFLRLAGFAGGFVAAWVGYLLRAAVLPDSTGGRAVVIALVIAVAVAIAAVSMGRVPLWSTLLGAAALAGAYEYTYSAAPPEVASTSVSTATALLFTAAVGFLATAIIAPSASPAERSDRAPEPEHHDETTSLDDMMMEKTK